MKIIDWYLGKTIIGTTTVSLSLLLAISGLFRFIDQLRSVGKGHYDVVHAGLFTLYSLASDIEVFFPASALIGGLFGLGMLASKSELVIMQVAGLSRFNILNSMLKTALLMIIGVMFLGEYIAPELQKKARELRAQAISKGNLISAKQGVWAKDNEQFVHIKEVIDTHHLQELTVYQFNPQLELQGILSADSAKFINNKWQLNVVTQLVFHTKTIQKEEFENMAWKSTLTPDKLGVVAVKRPEYLSMTELVRYLDYLAINQQEGLRYELAFWRKLVQPFMIAVMLMLALSFIFGPLRSMTMGARMVLGLLAGFSFYMANQVLGSLTLVYQLPAFFGAIFPSIICIAIATYLLKRH